MPENTPEFLPLSLFEGYTCFYCGFWKHVSEFYHYSKRRCKSCHREYGRKWREANPCYMKDYNQQYRDRRILLRRDNWRIKSQIPEYIQKHRDRNARFVQQNPDWHKAKYHTRRTHKVQAGGEYTPEQWQALCARFQFRCVSCGETKPLTVDHIVPVSKGGNSDIDNLQPLCKPCNSRKGVQVIDYRLTFVPQLFAENSAIE